MLRFNVPEKEGAMKSNVEKISIGTAVKWKWLGRMIGGTIKEVYFMPISKVIKGKTIKRNGSPENPAYLVESAAGNLALKLESEIQVVNKLKQKQSKPKMFAT